MLTRHLGAALCVMALAACTDPASAPMADDLVAQATEMEHFAMQAAARGDVQGSADINFIANALRQGRVYQLPTFDERQPFVIVA